MRRIFTTIVAAMTLHPAGSVALAWHDEGHLYTALAAVEALPDDPAEDVPAFFRDEAATVAHLSIDPDVWRNPLAPQLRDATSSDHFIDMEYLEGLELPATRSLYVGLCLDHGIDPQQAGYLPYAIAEGAQRLAVAFAEHRRYPDNPHIRLKCLVYAGVLAHFTADLHMPLHTTLHHDGRRSRRDDGSWDPSPRTGIHARIDALPTKLPFNVLFAEPITPEDPGGELMPLIEHHLRLSHARLDALYELEPAVPALTDMALDDERVRAFAIERTRAAAAFTSQVFLHAWRLSQRIDLPDWLDRRTLDMQLDRDHVPPQPMP